MKPTPDMVPKMKSVIDAVTEYHRAAARRLNIGAHLSTDETLERVAAAEAAGNRAVDAFFAALDCKRPDDGRPGPFYILPTVETIAERWTAVLADLEETTPL